MISQIFKSTLFILIGLALLLGISTTSIFADTIQPPFKRCTAIPNNPQPGENVSLEVETKNETKLNVFIRITNLTTKKETGLPYQDNAATRIRTIPLGSFNDPGTYRVIVSQISNLAKCQLEAAFQITSNPNYPNLKLLAPQSPITEKITILPSLIIDGLTSGKTYNIKLPNWKGDDLADHTRPNPKDWPAIGDGTIYAQNICNDGKASSNKCTDPFGPQPYNLDIYEKSGSFVGSLSFLVDYSTSGSGKNPCGPEGKECPTALGKIPTNPKDFAQRLLNVAIGLAGGIAFILMVIGSIRVLTSSGDQQKLSAGRDMIVAAIAGLLFIIFSVLILQFIGIEIIGLSG